MFILNGCEGAQRNRRALGLHLPFG
jgi:hypothetical protein